MAEPAIKVVSFEMSDEFLTRVFAAVNDRRRQVTVAILVVMFAAVVLMFVHALAPTAFRVAAIAIAAVVVLAVAFVVVRSIGAAATRRETAAGLAKLAHRTASWHFFPDRLVVRTATGETVYEWSKLRNVVAYDSGLWSVEFEPQGTFLPAEVVDRELVRLLADKAGERGGGLLHAQGLYRIPFSADDDNAWPRPVPSLGWRRFVPIGVILAAAVAVGYWAMPGRMSVDERFSLKADDTKIVRLDVPRGKWLEITATVTSGDRISVFVVRDVEVDKKQTRLLGAEFPPGREVRDYRHRGPWRWPEAMVIVNSAGQSDVRLQARIVSPE